MGRKYEHKASKSFTICLAELSWLAEYSDRVKKKQSVVVNELIRTAMNADRTAETEHKYVSVCEGKTKNSHFLVLVN